MEAQGRRERKKERTRIDLMWAAIELIREKGYDSTSIDDIVERADYSRSTFFRYFPGKEDVLFADLPEKFGQVMEMLDGAPDDADPFETVRAAVTGAIVELASGAPELEAACFDLWLREPALYRRYMEFVVSTETMVATFLARRWGADPARNTECATIAAGVIGVARAVIQLQLVDPVVIRKELDRGFDVLEQGVAASSLRIRRRARALSRAPGG